MVSRTTDFDQPGRQASEWSRAPMNSAMATRASAVGGNTGSKFIRNDEIWRAIKGVQRWVEAREYRGYEPFDGLSSWARSWTGGNQLAERILQQAIRQCPFNLRPLF